MRIIPLALTACAAAVTFAAPGAAQVMVDVPIWSNGILGQQALRTSQENFDRAHGINSDGEKADAGNFAACSADALPTAERRRLEAEYVRRVRADGKDSADAWVREQGKRFRLKLIADGVCSAPSGEAQIARNDQTDADGKAKAGDKGCRMEVRPVAGFGGAPMTMGMVSVCD